MPEDSIIRDAVICGPSREARVAARWCICGISVAQIAFRASDRAC
jgi:hypothetical protein